MRRFALVLLFASIYSFSWAQSSPQAVYISGTLPGNCIAPGSVNVRRPALMEANGRAVQAMTTYEGQFCGYSFGHFSGATPPGGATRGPITYTVQYSHQILAKGYHLLDDGDARIVKNASKPAALKNGTLYQSTAPPFPFVTIVDDSGKPANTELYDVLGTLTISVDVNNVFAVKSRSQVCRSSSGALAKCPS